MAPDEMRIVRTLMLVIGLLAIAFGLLFTLQGLGIVHWPRRSFMLDDTSWAWRGGIMVIGGVLMAWYGRGLR
jgi:hypothetical protein